MMETMVMVLMAIDPLCLLQKIFAIYSLGCFFVPRGRVAVSSQMSHRYRIVHHA
jgi:hypothetical protein